MTIKVAVDRGIELRAMISAAEEELKVCDEALRSAALNGEQVELVDPDRDGRQFLAHGSALIVPVVITSDSIVGTVAEGTPQHARLEAASRGRLAEFFRRKITWANSAKSGKQFRLEAAALLGADAPAFVDAALSRDKFGMPKNQVKVEWDRAEEAK